MTKMGADAIKSIYVGNIPIKKAFVGTDLVFNGQKSRLPEGYTELAYISNPNLGALTTIGSVYNPVTKYRLEIKLRLNDLSKAGRIYGAERSQTYVNGNYSYGGSYLAYSADSRSISMRSAKTGIPVNEEILDLVVDSSQSLFSINGVEGEFASSYIAAYGGGTGSLLFGTRYENVYKQNKPVISSGGTMDFNLYSFKAIDITGGTAGQILSEYVPCVSPDDEVGIYDVAREIFQKSWVNGTVFVAGPAI